MKYLITRNPLLKWVNDKILLVRFTLHYFFMEKYLKEWAKFEDKTVEQFKKENFCSGEEAYYNFLEKFDLDDFNDFKRHYFLNILTR